MSSALLLEALKRLNVPWLRERASHDPASHQAALCPWGDAAYLSPLHLPLCIEGDPDRVELAATRLLAEAQAQHIPIFVQEGTRELVSAWPHFRVPKRYMLPPLRGGATAETVHQTLAEIKEWLNVVECSTGPSPWPALLVCSDQGIHRTTMLDAVNTLNRERKRSLGVIYLLHTQPPMLDQPEFAAQLSCQASGKAVLRRHQTYQGLQLEHEGAFMYEPINRRRASTSKSMA